VAARSVSGRTSREFGRPGRHLLEVVNDLLDVSRLEAGRFPVTLALARIGHAIDAAVSDIAPQAASKGIKVGDRRAGPRGGCAVLG
jgi:signal transduction histidine kinase